MKFLAFIFILLFFVFVIPLKAQENSLRNSMYIEIGGSGLFASINYERQLTKLPALSARIGLGFYTEKALYTTLPIGINYVLKLSKSHSYLDVGMAVSYANRNHRFFIREKGNTEGFTSFIPSIGYRKDGKEDLFWRVSFTPVINEFSFVPWFGFSFGKKF